MAQKLAAQSRLIGERAMTGAECRRRWLSGNREKSRQVNRDAHARKVRRINDYKAARGCEDCGISDHRVLDLHHRHPAEKTATVSEVKAKRGWKMILSEMEKCDVLCANCHRIRHHEERQREGADIQMTTGAFFRAS